MTALFIAVGVILVVAAVGASLLVLRAMRDPLDRKVARTRVAQVLDQALASVPANAFDARMRIVRSHS